MLVDVHCHLDHPRFKGEIDKVVENAKKAGVVAVHSSGVDPNTNRKVLEYAKKYDIVKASLGIFPAEAIDRDIGQGNEQEYGVSEKFDYDEEIKFIESQKDNIVCIGECGLDYEGIKEMDEDEANKYKEKQKRVFKKLIELAKKIDKPILVHSRKAEADCIEILEESELKPSQIIMHCFGGKLKLAIKAAKNGYMFSIPPKIKRLRHFQEIVKNLNINQILTETDAPYQAPEPAQRNEPAFVAETIKMIAEIKDFTEEETENNIYMNYQNTFQ